MSESPPFVVLGLPRSRTYWLSQALTYGGWYCSHDEAARFRTLDDIKAWLSQPNTGSVETAVATYWRHLMRIRPDVRVAVVRRPVDDCVASWLKVAPQADESAIRAQFLHLNRKLDQIEARVPGVVSVEFSALSSPDTGARLFAHLLGRSFDAMWWAAMSALNLQIHIPAALRYANAYREALLKVSGQVRQQELAALSRRTIRSDGVTYQTEDAETWYAEGAALMAAHMVRTGQSADGYLHKNVDLWRKLASVGAVHVTTARCNGRMVGYRVSIVGPSLDQPGVLAAEHTAFFADPDFPGVGLRIARESDAALRRRGVKTFLARAGIVGSGEKMGVLYRRMGYEEFGRMYRWQERA